MHLRLVLAIGAILVVCARASAQSIDEQRAAHLRELVDRVLVDAAAGGIEEAAEVILPMDVRLTMLQDGSTSAPAANDAPSAGSTGSSADELSRKLANPISDLISVPFQNNFQFGAGPDGDGFRYLMNFQPVVPLSLNDDLNLIIRTIVPIIYQDDIVFDSEWDQFGLGDTVQSFFFSPKKPGPGGMIWGAGPVFLWPTGTNDSLGAEQWGIGPTGVVLFQNGPWTYGGLANHIWSYAGDDDRPDVNATFMQPFVTYQLGDGWSVGGNAEITYDWEAEDWTVPLFPNFSKVFSIGDQMVSIQAGPQLFVEAPDNGPEWAIRINFTLLFPK